MDVRDCLEGVRTLGYDPALGRQQPALGHLRLVKAALPAHLPPEGYKVLVSGAGISLAHVPWIAVLDPSVTATAQSGLYVVYLYSTDLTRVYLTMNQGVTAHKENALALGLGETAAERTALAALAKETAAIRDELGSTILAGLTHAINLGAQRYLARGYEIGTIAAIEYDTAALPPEAQLKQDLYRFLEIYEATVEVRTRLTAQNPSLYNTPAIASPSPGPASIFRPKDASDYTATVTAHTQHRTRKHEAVVRAYGEHARDAGWTPATNVHPRDLVLRKGQTEVLCEVKVVGPNAEHAVREAIGQLFTYRYFYPTAQPSPLLAVFSKPVGDAFVDLLEAIGISSVWAEGGDQWGGSQTAKSQGLS